MNVIYQITNKISSHAENLAKLTKKECPVQSKRNI